MAFDTLKRSAAVLGIVAAVFAMVLVIARSAQQRVGLDGFSICSFAMQQCEPVNEATLRARSLSPAEAGIVQQIQRLITTRDQAALDDLAKLFADPQRPVDTPNVVDLWYPDRHVTPPSACFLCGLHLRFFNRELGQVNYGVQGKFMVLWNRVLTKPAK
jgi:hypothetical protein